MARPKERREKKGQNKSNGYYGKDQEKKTTEKLYDLNSDKELNEDIRNGRR